LVTIFHGLVSPERSRELLTNARYLVVPSIWYENQPLVVIEAMAQGTPVIAASTGALKELMKEGVNGFPFAPGNTANLVTIMNSIEELEEIKYSRLSSSTRSTYESSHTPEKHVSMLTEIYSRAINAHRIA